jgi:hypothetical protein
VREEERGKEGSEEKWVGYKLRRRHEREGGWWD